MQRVGQRPTHQPPATSHAFAARGRLLAAACLALLASGCSNIGYYWQSVSGQLEIWNRQRPVEEVIADPATSAMLKGRLERVIEIRNFASRELGLPQNDSYRRYADLERPYVVWNVFAAPEFSVAPLRWCFSFVGCVEYRGYFSRADAEVFAASVKQRGDDVYIGGVPAYSTLGWFADPVLNTFVYYPEIELARLIFHELAHQVAYVRDDTTFNESFAVAVELEGMRRWLARPGDEARRDEFERRRRIRAEFAGMMLKYRARLAALYRTRIAPEEMRSRKRAVLAELEAEYRALREQWGGFAGYDPWFAGPVNNAQLASVAIYTQLVRAFEALLEAEGGDLPRFYAAVRRLADLPREERDERLRSLAPSAATYSPRPR